MNIWGSGNIRRGIRAGVNWKATARSGELKVNQKGCTAQRSVRLVVNLEDGAILRQEDLLEASIEMAAAAAELFIGQGIRTSLETNGPDLLTKEAVCPESILRRGPSGQHFTWTGPDRLGEAGTFL